MSSYRTCDQPKRAHDHVKLLLLRMTPKERRTLLTGKFATAWMQPVLGMCGACAQRRVLYTTSGRAQLRCAALHGTAVGTIRIARCYAGQSPHHRVMQRAIEGERTIASLRLLPSPRLAAMSITSVASETCVISRS